VSVALYRDVHIRFALTEDLRLHGVDVLTAQEDGTTAISDSELLDRATSLGRVVFSHDKDFLREASKRQQSGQFFAGVI
jgi:predicted nuclease of predicted toxin-antitoxin system